MMSTSRSWSDRQWLWYPLLLGVSVMPLVCCWGGTVGIIAASGGGSSGDDPGPTVSDVLSGVTQGGAIAVSATFSANDEELASGGGPVATPNLTRTGANDPYQIAAAVAGGVGFMIMVAEGDENNMPEFDQIALSVDGFPGSWRLRFLPTTSIPLQFTIAPDVRNLIPEGPITIRARLALRNTFGEPAVIVQPVVPSEQATPLAITMQWSPPVDLDLTVRPAGFLSPGDSLAWLTFDQQENQNLDAFFSGDFNCEDLFEDVEAVPREQVFFTDESKLVKKERYRFDVNFFSNCFFFEDFAVAVSVIIQRHGLIVAQDEVFLDSSESGTPNRPEHSGTFRLRD